MKVIFIVGPTASGKSKLAIDLCLFLKKHAQENPQSLALNSKNPTPYYIVNADSIQLYQELDIGSAKPTPEEQSLVPHLLFDQVKPLDEVTAGKYEKWFFATLAQLPPESVVFVVGGTGFYFQALEKGMFEIGASNEQVKAQVEQELKQVGGPERLFAELKSMDPQTAEKISMNDHYRLGRFVEIIRSHGLPVSQLQENLKLKQRPFPYPLLKLGIWMERDQLEPIVKVRTEKMLQAGWLTEVKNIIKKYPQAVTAEGVWAPLESVGYYQVLEFLQQQKLLEDSIEASSVRLSHFTKEQLQALSQSINTATLQLTKKQRTWFKRDKDIHWLADSYEQNLNQAIQLVQKFLSNYLNKKAE